MPAYGGWTLDWGLSWAGFWLSWLVWPLLAWALWRRRWLLGLPLLLLVEMRFVEPALLTERHTTLQLGFQARVALIADYHVGLYKGPAYLARVVERLNAMELDAVLIAGDHLYEPDRPISELLAPLKQLRHPTYSVPGNHDELPFGPVQHAELRAVLQSLGVKTVEYGHLQTPKFTVVGLGDRFAHKDNPAPLRAAPRDKPIIVLAHNPDSAMQLERGSAALFVAGHTHGGQLRIPWLYRRVIPCDQPFDRGLHSFAPVPVFVTTGLGEVGPPMRFLNPPVIDVLDIR